MRAKARYECKEGGLGKIPFTFSLGQRQALALAPRKSPVAGSDRIGSRWRDAFFLAVHACNAYMEVAELDMALGTSLSDFFGIYINVA
jgi:hypothetical protein